MDTQEKPTLPPPEPLGTMPGTDEAIPVSVKENIRRNMEKAKREREEFAALMQERARLQAQDSLAQQEGRWRGQSNGTSGANLPHAYSMSAKRPFRIKLPRAHQRQTRPTPSVVTENERLWAMLAHASTLLTMAGVVFSGGLLSLLTIFIPLFIYLAYREKSVFVAHHALQAFAAQVVGTIGFILLLLTVVVSWALLITISALLILVIIGIVLLPLVILVGVVALAATLALPLAVLVYSMIGASQAWGREFFSYPWLGDWVDGQIYQRV
jgi:uncharacterized Tic20 family protein